MRELVDAGLIRPIVPEEYTSQLFSAIHPFLEFVDADAEIQRRRARGEVAAGTMVQIHGGKVGLMLATELMYRDLARPAAHEEWYAVEARTASAFMAHLAATLGQCDDVKMDPVTDAVSNLAAFGETPEAPADPMAVARGLRMAVLEGVLPGPTTSVPARELADFKERHANLLGSLRRRIEPRLFEIALIENEDVREEQARLFVQELAAELEELERRMRERKWPRLVFGTLCGVVGAAIPVGAAAATGALPAAVAGVPGLAHAVYSAVGALSRREDVMREPLAYAALSRRSIS